MDNLNNNKKKRKVDVEVLPEKKINEKRKLVCKHKTCNKLNLTKCRFKPEIIKVSNDLGQDEVPACLPISVLAARTLYEKEDFGKEDFEKAINDGIELWGNWSKNNGKKYDIMHFGDVKTIDGNYESIKEFLGKNINVTTIEKEVGYKHFTTIWSELNAHQLYTAIFTCDSMTYMFGKRNNKYFYLDSHGPNACIHISEQKKYLFKKLFYKIYADTIFEVIAFI